LQRGARFVQPRLVAEVQHLAGTDALRHAVLRGGARRGVTRCSRGQRTGYQTKLAARQVRDAQPTLLAKLDVLAGKRGVCPSWRAHAAFCRNRQGAQCVVQSCHGWA
jgi:hypothetical protein